MLFIYNYVPAVVLILWPKTLCARFQYTRNYNIEKFYFLSSNDVIRVEEVRPPSRSVKQIVIFLCSHLLSSASFSCSSDGWLRALLYEYAIFPTLFLYFLFSIFAWIVRGDMLCTSHVDWFFESFVLT